MLNTYEESRYSSNPFKTVMIILSGSVVVIQTHTCKETENMRIFKINRDYTIDDAME